MAKADGEMNMSGDSSKTTAGDTAEKTRSTAKSIKTYTNTTDSEFNMGYWKMDEHERFLEGFQKHGKAWKKIATQHVKTRSRVQVRIHAQKYFKRLSKEQQLEAIIQQENNKGDNVSSITSSHEKNEIIQVKPCTSMKRHVQEISPDDQREATVKRQHRVQEGGGGSDIEICTSEQKKNDNGAVPPRLPQEASRKDTGSLSAGLPPIFDADMPSPNDVVFGSVGLKTPEKTLRFLHFCFYFVCDYYKAGGGGSRRAIVEKAIPLWKKAYGTNAHSKRDHSLTTCIQFWERKSMCKCHCISETTAIKKIVSWLGHCRSRRSAIEKCKEFRGSTYGNDSIFKMMEQELALGGDLDLSSSMVSQQLEPVTPMNTTPAVASTGAPDGRPGDKEAAREACRRQQEESLESSKRTKQECR